MVPDRLDKLCIPPPWFVFDQDGEQKMQTFCTIWPQNKSYVMAIPELQGKIVRASNYGWLLLHDTIDCSNLSLWNPLTLETIPLPPLGNLLFLEDDSWITCCALTSSPDEDDNFGVFVFYEHFAFSCRPRHESGWQGDGVCIDGIQAYVSQAVTCDGVMYAYVSLDALYGRHLRRCFITTINADVPYTAANYDDDDGDFLLLDMPEYIMEDAFDFAYLLECCGQVYCVCLLTTYDSPGLDAVEVWKLDLEEKKKWVEVKSLDDRAFFLGKNCSTWCWATPQVEGNSVYFSMESHDVGNSLYQYKLEDRSLTLCKPCPNLLTHWRNPFWFIPQLHRSLARSLCKTGIKQVNNSLNQNTDIVKPKELQNQNKVDINMLDGLPLDVIELISKYLDWFDYMSFRTTCRSYRSALPPGRCHRGRTYDSSLPVFVYLKNNEGLFQVMHPTRNKACSIVTPKPPEGAFCIKYCKDGWIVLYSGSKTCEYFSLFSKLRGEFPRIDNKHEENLKTVGFSTSPGSSDCEVVAISGNNRVYIHYLRYKDQIWEYAEFNGGGNTFVPSVCPPVYHNGGFYFLDYYGRLGVLKLVGQNPTWHVFGRPQTKETQFHSLHLLECDGQLYSVFIGRFGNWIQVFSFDEVNNSWVTVESLGKHVFFVSQSSSISTIAREVGMSNRIYLPRLVENRFMFYSLETRKYHVQGTDQQSSMDNFCRSKEPFECCWV